MHPGAVLSRRARRAARVCAALWRPFAPIRMTASTQRQQVRHLLALRARGYWSDSFTQIDLVLHALEHLVRLWPHRRHHLAEFVEHARVDALDRLALAHVPEHWAGGGLQSLGVGVCRLTLRVVHH